ncbi:MAG: tetratricopeptide repeat protein, partial [Cyanobacteria bacterium J06558_2]
MQDSYISSFTPSLMSPQDLEAIFVQREKLVQDLMAEVRESATTDNKHYRLLIGMRGIGKTHTIALLYHRLRSLEDLQDRLVIAWLKEEEWGVSSWLDLQIRIFQAIANSAPEEYQNQLAAEVNGLYQLSPTEATARGEIILKEFIGDRTLLILTENLDEIMKGLGDIGQKKFCAFLQNTRLVTMVATAQSLSKDLTLKKRAFYGFFNINDLDQLSLKEAGNLLTKIAELQKDEELNKFIRTQVGQDRIKAIHHLAGGNHRVYIIFSQFLTRDSLDDLVKPVMQTLDELTPYYQARMQWLSPQQRKIIELLCDRRHAVAVKEIAQRCFISHQTASSQLKDLLTKGYVVKETQGRESFYELQEPLMRICLEVKKQRGEPIKLFIDFLRIWYTNRELESRLKQLAPDCLERQYILKALELPPIFPEAIDLSKSEQLNNLLQEIVNCYRQEDYQSALTLCDRAIEIDPNDYFIWFFYGYLLAKIEQDELAIKSYNRALELNPNIDIAWFSHGCLLAKTGKYELAIKSYNRALELNPDNDNIWLNLAISLGILGQPELAIESCERALKINPDNELIWHCRGIVLHDSEKYALAVESYDRAIKLNPDSDNTWNNRGISLD